MRGRRRRRRADRRSRRTSSPSSRLRPLHRRRRRPADLRRPARRPARPLRVLGQIRPVVDQLARDRPPGCLRPAGDRAHQLVVPVAVERPRHLAMRGREALLGEGVRRGLVVADVQQVRVRRRSCRARRGRTARRSRRPARSSWPAGIITIRSAAVPGSTPARPAGLEVGRDGLAGRLEVLERRAHFLQLAHSAPGAPGESPASSRGDRPWPCGSPEPCRARSARGPTRALKTSEASTSPNGALIFR